MFGRSIFFVIISIFSIIHANNGNAKSPPPGSGVADVPANIFFLLDTSGSMDTYVSYTERFSYPYDMATDSSGNIYIAEVYNGVYVYDKDGNYIRNWGSFSSNYTYRSDNDEFYYIYGIAVDADDDVYVCDLYHKRIQVFDVNGGFKRSISLPYYCYGVEISPDNVVYATLSDGNIYRYTTGGTSLGKWNMSGDALNIAFDKDERHYVLRYTSNDYRIYVYDENRNYESYVEIEDDDPHVEYPTSIAVGDDYSIYISESDYYDSRVYRLTKKSDRSHINDDGDVASDSYVGGYRSSNPGYFRTPYGVHYDNVTGKVLIADYGNHRIQSYDGSVNISGLGETRLDVMKKVIKKIVSDSALTDGAHYGMAEWNNDAEMLVEVSESGAADIYDTIDDLTAGGGTDLDSAMHLALPYFVSENGPRDHRLPCQKNIIIVLSDGYWQNNSATEVAENLSGNHDVFTHIIGFQVTGDDNYTELAIAGGTYPDSPLFAEDWTDLYEKIAEVVRDAINADLTFAAPTIMPDVVGDDHILQATFKYKPDHQWKGRLKKYALDADGFVAGLQWDAGERMNLISADARNIWTAAQDLPSGMNNFTVANADLLQPEMESRLRRSMDDADLADLIEFVRGRDVYSEFTSGRDDDGDAIYAGDRWKLADVYHSRALAVGSPAARYAAEANPVSDAYYRYANNYGAFVHGDTCGGACARRKGVVYVGSNGGMLHAFDTATGDELWGFIPPMLLGSFNDMRSETAGESLAIFGVDGSPAVKDVFDGENWRTVLVVGLRQGGSGYSVLDVTDPLAPSHMYSIAYDNFNDEVVYWGEDGDTARFRKNSNVPAAFDVRRLGESWSDPVILRLPVGADGDMRWTFAVGGGYNSGSNSDYGDAVFVFDIFGASPLAASVTLPDLSNGDKIANAAPPRLAAITADTTGNFTHAGAMLYVTDLQGELWKIDATDRGHFMEARRVLDLATSRNNQRFPFQQIVSGFSGGKLYHVAGTGNVLEPDEVTNQIDNVLFSVADEDFPHLLQNVENEDGSTSEYERSPYGLHDLTVGGVSGGTCDVPANEGWYLPIEDSGKILSPATIFNHGVLVPVYYPNEENICSGGGSRLLEMRLACGAEARETDLGGGISTRAVVYNNKVYLGISDSDSDVPLPEGFVKTGNLIVGTPINERATQVEVESWWEGR